MSLSIIGRSIAESVTLKLNETAAILRAKGEPVIHLGIGEPKSKAPLDAIIAAASLLNTGEIRYTPADGIPALKQAIIRYVRAYCIPCECHRLRRGKTGHHGCPAGYS
jgi:aspartate/methionine/tyrosine aminotransferase